MQVTVTAASVPATGLNSPSGAGWADGVEDHRSDHHPMPCPAAPLLSFTSLSDVEFDAICAEFADVDDDTAFAILAGRGFDVSELIEPEGSALVGWGIVVAMVVATGACVAMLIAVAFR